MKYFLFKALGEQETYVRIIGYSSLPCEHFDLLQDERIEFQRHGCKSRSLESVGTSENRRPEIKS